MLRRGLMAAGGGGDPHWADVVSLLHFDGADGSTTFTDQKGHVWTRYGDAQIDTAQSKFGGASGLFDVFGDAIEIPHTSSLDLDSAEWTIETYLRWNGASGPMAVLSKRMTTGTSSAGWTAFTNGGSVRIWNGSSEVGTPSVLSASVWTHVVWQRRAGNLEIYVGGTLQYSGAYAITANSYPVTVGCAYWNGGRVDFFGGHIDELRVTKGVARYMSNFTPPSTPFPSN